MFKPSGESTIESTMLLPPHDLVERLDRFHQRHLLLGWADLEANDQIALLQQIESIDFHLLLQLYHQRDQHAEKINWEEIQPIQAAHVDLISSTSRQKGIAAIANNQTAVLLVAGGQGSRLGFDKPKGMFPIAPISENTLFQIHCEKVLALRRKHQCRIPLLIMTSPATHQDTVDYFEDAKFFGLPSEDVFFFQQGTMPALDLLTGKIILEAPGKIFTSPNGHGGTLTALAHSGLLEVLSDRGVKHLFYFQVDNPLVHILDERFLGEHIERNIQVSSKAITKVSPGEKMGVFIEKQSRCGIIEYSDMPADKQHELDNAGNLLYRYGNPAIHIFDVAFLAEITENPCSLPFHLARKKVPFMNLSGQFIEPEKENALKFEMFIFDALPLASRWLIMENRRHEEFAPVKNATGADSPHSCKKALIHLHAHWLEQHGAIIEKDDSGHAKHPIEISPLFANSLEDLHGKIDPGLVIDQPLLLISE